MYVYSKILLMTKHRYIDVPVFRCDSLIIL
jgi:hypothetical protein